MSLRNQTRRERLRAHASTPSPGRGDLKISGPFPHPFPAHDLDLPASPNLHSSNPPSLESLNQIHKTHSSLRSSAPDVSNCEAYSDPLGQSSHIPHVSVSSNISRASAMHRRRGSTLKTVMRKIFGRRHRGDFGDRELSPEIRRDTPSRSRRTPDPQRSNSPFVTAPDMNPSRSHRSSSLPNQSISPKNNSKPSTISSVSPASEGQPPSDYILQHSPRRRRRATLPSVVLSTEEVRDLTAKVAQDVGMAGSVHSTSGERESVDSLARKVANQYRRRSRSAYALRETAKAHRMSPIQWRQRSEEIKYWRNSALKMNEAPIPARPETCSIMDTAVDEKGSTEIDDQGFDLSTLMGPTQQGHDGYLAQRVATLEVKLMDLEFAIAKLQENKTTPVHVPSFDKSSRRWQHSPIQEGTDDDISPIQDSAPFSSSFSTPSITPPRSSPAPEEGERGSTATLRPYTSPQPQSIPSPYQLSTSDFSGISVEQYSALTTLVRREQSARKLLEGQLLQMQKDMQNLHSNDGPQSSVQANTFPRSSRQSSTEATSSYQRGSRWGKCESRTGRKQQTSEHSGDESSVPDSYQLDTTMYDRMKMATTPSRNHVPGMI